MHRTKRGLIFTAAAAAAMVASTALAANTPYYWDPGGGTPPGTGTGTWNTSTPNWNPASDGSGTQAPWPNTTAYDAHFGGVDGTYAVTVGANLNAGTISFDHSGYTLSASAPETVSFNGNIAITGGATAALGNDVTLNNSSTVLTVQTTGGTGPGVFDISTGGTLTGNQNPLYVNASVDVQSGGMLTTTGGGTSIAIGGNGTGATGLLTVDGGTVIAGALIVLANAAGNTTSTTTGTLTLNTGTVTTSNLSSGLRLNNQNYSSTTVNLNGGTLSIPAIFAGTANTSVSSTFNFNGGTLQANASSASFFPVLNATTAVVKAGGAVIDSQSFGITIAQPLIHDASLGGTPDGGLTKLGSGTLTLTGGSTYTGPTSVVSSAGASAGTLLINFTQSSAGSYAVTGAAGGAAILGGTGTINLASGNTVTVSGTSATQSNFGAIAPGGTGTIGTMTITGGTVAMNAHSQFLVDTGSGTSSDKLAAGPLTLNGAALALTSTNIGTYTIATYSSLSGTFGSVVVDNGGGAAMVNYGTGTNSQITVNVTAVPEPASAALLGLASLGLLARRRSRAGRPPIAPALAAN